jgi:type IV pilus assembly protein PilP
MKYFSFLCLSLFLAGCQANIDDLQVFIAQVQDTTPVAIEPYPQFASKPAFIYAANTSRSPFQRPRNTGVEVKVAAQHNCAQPDFNRTKQPLEKFGIDALAVTGEFYAKGKKWALIQSNTGGLFKAKIGDYLGLFFGRIDAIQNGTVSYTEMLPDGAGCWQKKPSTLTIMSKAGEINV